MKKKFLSILTSAVMAMSLTPLSLNVYAGTTADNGFSETEISESETKPKIFIDNLSIYSDKATAGMTVPVNIIVTGASNKYASTGLHVFYDERLTLAEKSDGSPNIISGSAIGALEYDFTELDSGIFLTTSGKENTGLDGQMWTIFFTLPEDMQTGDKFPITIEYVEEDTFTNAENDKNGQLMGAYLFTQGISDGSISITDPPTNTSPVYTYATLTTRPTAPNPNTTTTTTTTTVTPPEQKPLYTLGDTNGDGIVDAKDASLILEEYSRRSTGNVGILTENQLKISDVNSDGVADAIDASKILWTYTEHMNDSTKTHSYSQGEGKEDYEFTLPEYKYNPNGNFTADEIMKSEYKPKINISAETDTSYYPPQVKVTFSLAGAMPFSTFGFNIAYDDRMSVVYDRFRNPEFKTGTALEYLSKSLPMVNEKKHIISISGASSDENGFDGELFSVYFNLSTLMKKGDTVNVGIEYQGGELFTDTADSESARLAQAYLFTKGLSKLSLTYDGDDNWIINTKPVETPVIIYGDTDESGDVNINDTVLIMQSIANPDKYKITENGMKNADIVDRGDGVTNSDALAIQYVESRVLKMSDFPITSEELDKLGQ
ncbi:MAG: hypothetical protein K2J08_12690 [Ruminococcus sp.]|nr:hypothetical protein [Ruminococcus sp.]